MPSRFNACVAYGHPDSHADGMYGWGLRVLVQLHGHRRLHARYTGNRHAGQCNVLRLGTGFHNMGIHRQRHDGHWDDLGKQRDKLHHVGDVHDMAHDARRSNVLRLWCLLRQWRVQRMLAGLRHVRHNADGIAGHSSGGQ